MLPTRAFFGIGLASVLTFSGASCHSSHYSEARNALVGAAGVKLIRIVSNAGTLKVDGRAGATNASVRGVAIGSGKRMVSGIHLVATRVGDVITIKPQLPGRRWFNWGRGSFAALDMAVTVPAGVPIEITDGSGDVVVRGVGQLKISDGSGDLDVQGVTGSIDITDGSGGIEVNGVDGDVRVNDGSGEISIANVTGNVDVPDDGSGSLSAEQVGGSVRVGDKGSGSLNVSHVGSDLIVEQKGSGAIRYDDVRGKVAIPARKE